MKIERYKGGRNWGLYDDQGELIAVIVYKKGANEVRRRLLEKQERATSTDAARTKPGKNF